MDIKTLTENLDDPLWRLSHLYKITNKQGQVVTFKLNPAQENFVSQMWLRNIILKARQLGFSTLICLLWLDTVLFSKNPTYCGIVAHNRESAENIFRGKVKFAYDRLPEVLRAQFALSKKTESMLEFAHNGSQIIVATSVRSGTIHRLLVSEFGKICKEFPDKAEEVVTGSFPAVPIDGITVIESTAEGREGYFYNMTSAALSNAQSGKALGEKDYRLCFYPWHEGKEYRMRTEGVLFTEAELRYFHEIEGKIGKTLDQAQRAWYAMTQRADFGGDVSKMWQEYPSYPEEAFKVSTEGCYYASQLADARKQGRIVAKIPVAGVPVNTFWDLGRGDMTAIWFHQRVGLEERFINYFEGSGEDLPFYARYLQSLPYTYGTHFLPHDADAQRLAMNTDENTHRKILEKLLIGQRFETIPRVATLQMGIQETREAFNSAWFDEIACDLGLKRLENYRKVWNARLGCWGSEPKHDENSHGADAFRQFAQAKALGLLGVRGAAANFKRRGSGMAV